MNIRPLRIVIPLVAPLALFAADGDLLNGDFEQIDADGRATDWTYEAKYFRVDRAGGRNGTAGLLFDNHGDGHGSPVLQRVRVQPGMRYMFGVWIKPEGLEGKGYGGRICILWEDGYGRSLDGYYVSGHIRGTSDWKLSEGMTTKAPATAVWATVRPEAVAPITGRAWFDDVFFKPMEEKPVSGLYSSAYRGEFAGGEVTFAASHLSAGRVEEKYRACHGEFAWIGPDGAKRTREIALSGSVAKLTLAASELAIGESVVGFRVVRKEDGAEIGRADTKIVRTERARVRRVAFDRRGRTLVDGKPFFPLGMYWSVAKHYHGFSLPTLNATSIVQFADSPFNCTMPYAGLSKAQLDLCAKHGIMAIYPLLSDFGGKDWDPTGKDRARAYPQAAYAHIRNYKDHPALLAWYINDERSLREIVNLRGRQRVVEELDPDHPSWICLYQYDQVGGYMGTFDCVGTDPYPVGGSSISRAYEWATASRDGALGIRPVWQVPQAFDWATFHSEPQKGDRMPTREEMKSMTWQSIAGGANGIIYYSYTYLMASPTTPFEKGWSDVKAAAQEVKDAFDILLSDGEPPVAKSSSASVPIRTWSNGAKRYLLAVNLTDAPAESTVAVEGGAAEPVIRAGAAEAAVMAGAFALKLPSHGYVMLEF